MKVLYINYICQKGHVNFDNIHIDALMSQGADVRLVLHKKIAEQLHYPAQQYAVIIPSWLDADYSNGIINRILFILTLIYLKTKLSFQKYDKVIVSSMEEISLGLIPLCRNKQIVCHDNARYWGTGIKGFFIKRIAKHNTFIVFNAHMAEPFRINGIRHYIISHGCVQPYSLDQSVTLPVNTESYDTVIFHPSKRPSKQFIKALKESISFQKYLKTNRILLILQELSPQNDISDHIIFIKEYLKFSQYKALFMRSDIILLAYPDDFTCRVSGVSFECMANKKRLLIMKNPSLDYCRKFYNYDPMFSNLEQLQERITYLKEHTDAECIAKSSELMPDYTDLLNSQTT